MNSHYNIDTFQPDRHSPRNDPRQESVASKPGRSPPAKALKGVNGVLDFPRAVKGCTLPGSPLENSAQMTQRSQGEQGERHRIAQILHDDLQQLLCSIQIKLSLHDELDGMEQKSLIAAIRSDITTAITMTRDLSSDLAPPGLENKGLREMLVWLGRHIQSKFGLAVDIVCPRNFRIGSEEMRIVVYQAVRELLFNVVKHAGTRSATVTLEIQRDRLSIQVSDSGKSMDEEKLKTLLARPETRGLAGIREQLILHGGDLQITSNKGNGTRVLVIIPKRSGETLHA